MSKLVEDADEWRKQDSAAMRSFADAQTEEGRKVVIGKSSQAA